MRSMAALLMSVTVQACMVSDRFSPELPFVIHPGPPSGPLPDPPSVSSIQPLVFDTYEGSGQVVHPDWAYTPPDWFETRQHLLITPYPYGNATFENPSEFQSVSGIDWTIPEGIENPIARPSGSSGYLSDPDVLYNPDAGELWLYYREVTSTNSIYLIRRGPDSTWSDPLLVAQGPNHTIVSQSIVRRGPEDWLMWSVNAGSQGCHGLSTAVEVRHSRNGVSWSRAVTVSLDQPGLFAWHIDVEWIPSRHEFWAVYNTKMAAGCTTTALYLATSPDGVHWTTYPNAVLARGAIPEFADIVYRSTFAYHPSSDEVTFWYSGAKYDGSGYQWRAAVERRSRASLFAQLTSFSLSADRAMAARLRPTNAPPLTNETAP
jgi:hypothetical protein